MMMMMSSSMMRLQGELRSLVVGVRGLAVATPQVPKKPNTPWLNFYMANLPKYKKSHPEVKTPQLMKLISEEWKGLPEATKTPMVALYEKEKAKYQQEMDRLPVDVVENIKERRSASKAIKTSKSASSELKQKLEEFGKPKRSMSSYMLYTAERRLGLSPWEKGMKPTEVVKMMAEEWKGMSEEKRAPFVKKQEQLREENRKAMEVWEARMEREGKMEGIRAAVTRVNNLRRDAL